MLAALLAYISPTIIVQVLMDTCAILFIAIYARMMRGYCLRKIIILCLTVFVTAGPVHTLLWHVVFPLLFSAAPAYFGIYALWWVIPSTAICLVAALLLTKLVENIRKKLNSSEQLLNGAMAVAVITLIFLYASIIITATDGYVFFSRYPWYTFLMLFFVSVLLVGFLLFVRSVSTDLKLKHKESEHELLKAYTSQTEEQQRAMRKFKHDYQNILLALDGFLSADDLSGAKEYFNTKIKPASEIITKNAFALEALSKIKVTEVKGILMAKLMLAQNLDIDVSFEAHETIEHISVDSVVLVRMLGIILDNAIEELEMLGEGTLTVACYTQGSAVTICVQNTCRADIDALYKLEEEGYSNKGEGRGLGLSNLSGLIADHCDTLSLQTNISDGTFTQTLWIGEVQ